MNVNISEFIESIALTSDERTDTAIQVNILTNKHVWKHKVKSKCDLYERWEKLFYEY